MYIRFKIPLNEASFLQKLAILSNALIMSLRAAPMKEPIKTPPAFSIAQASGEYGKTGYRSDDIEDHRMIGFNLFKPLDNEDLITPEFNEEEDFVIYWYNSIAHNMKGSSLLPADTEFLYRLRNATIQGDYKLFYELVAKKTDELSLSPNITYNM